MNSLAKTLRPLANRIANLVTRGTIKLVDASKKLQSVQVSMLENEIKGGLEHFEPYGFTSNPRPGAEALMVFLEGDRSHGIVIATPDRRYRIKDLPSGAVAVYVDEDNYLTINPDGTLTLKASTINITADTINSEGDWTHTGDITADGISLKHHIHSGVTTGTSTTGEPVP